MTLHLLNEEGKNICGRTRTVGGSVKIDQVALVTCTECLRKKISAKALGSDKSVQGSGRVTGHHPAHVSSPPVPYDPSLDLLSPLNPLSPLSPFSPLHHSDPSPHHDHAPSHDPSPSHDSGGYDSGGGGYDGGGSDGGGGGGMD